MNPQMKVAPRLGVPSERTTDRLIKAIALVLVIGIPLIAFVYWSDRHVDAGPSMADRAVAAAEAAVKANPNDLKARNQLASAYAVAKRYSDSITQFGEVLKADPKNGSAIIGRGLVYEKTNQTDLAKADFQAYVDANKGAEMAGSDPLLQQAYYQLGTLLLAANDAKGALAAFEGALKIDRSDADSLYGYGTAAIKTGDATNGVKALRKAIAFVPTGWCDPYKSLIDGYTALKDAPGTAYASGMVAACTGKPSEAKAALQPLVGTPYEADALIGLAYLASSQGDNATAASLFQQVLAKDSSNISASIGLKTVTAAASGVPATSPSAGGSN